MNASCLYFYFLVSCPPYSFSLFLSCPSLFLSTFHPLYLFWFFLRFSTYITFHTFSCVLCVNRSFLDIYTLTLSFTRGKQMFPHISKARDICPFLSIMRIRGIFTSSYSYYIFFLSTLLSLPPFIVKISLTLSLSISCISSVAR